MSVSPPMHHGHMWPAGCRLLQSGHGSGEGAQRRSIASRHGAAAAALSSTEQHCSNACCIYKSSRCVWLQEAGSMRACWCLSSACWARAAAAAAAAAFCDPPNQRQRARSNVPAVRVHHCFSPPPASCSAILPTLHLHPTPDPALMRRPDETLLYHSRRRLHVGAHPAPPAP